MLKTFSAIVIAASIVAAPAMASGPGRTAIDHKVAEHKIVTPGHHVQVRPSALNANAKMMHRHHDHHRHVRSHFRFHKKLGLGHARQHTAIKSTVVHKRG